MSDMAAVNLKANPVALAIIVGFALLLGAWTFGLFSSSPSGASLNMKELLAASINVARLGGDAVKEIREKNDLNEEVKGETKEGAKELKSNGDMASHHIMYYGIIKGFPEIHVESEEHDNKLLDLSSVIDVVKDLPELKNIGDVYVSPSDITVWVDPLDATQEYTENLRQYVTTMVCVAVKGKPAIGVIHRAFDGETYWAYLGHGHSENLQPKVHDHKDKPYSIIVSRSHSGPVEEVAKKSFGENTAVVPAGGAGYKTLEVIAGNVDAYVHVTAIKKWDICAGNAIIMEMGGKQTTLKDQTIDYSTSGTALNSDGLLVTLKDHSKYLQALRPSFEESQGDRHKRDVSDNKENYRVAERETQ